jgi:hypothetical protein
LEKLRGGQEEKGRLGYLRPAAIEWSNLITDHRWCACTVSLETGHDSGEDFKSKRLPNVHQIISISIYGPKKPHGKEAIGCVISHPTKKIGPWPDVLHLRFVMGITVSPFRALSALAWLFLATAYTIPAKNPNNTADTDPKLTGSPKKTIPDAATGSLFSAPTILITDKYKSENLVNVRFEPIDHTYRWCWW